MTGRSQDEQYMRIAVRLARKGAGRVSPNPMVGAVIVKRGQIVGKGYHRRFGGPHAEVYALQTAGNSARGADAYVSLEPCCHHGKTAPCTDALIGAGVRRVVVGMADPNPAVRGKGIAVLRGAGIEVVEGVLEPQCRRLNESFIKFITTGLPYVILKSALSLDGKTATRTGHSTWITCEESRRRVHRVRAEADAILTGAGTVIADNPQMNVRLWKGACREPLRVVLDERLRIPLARRVLQPPLAAGTLVATAPGLAAGRKARSIEKNGAEVVGVPLRRGNIDLAALLKLLGGRNIARVLIEAGAELNASALEAGLVDKLMLFYAPKIIGGRTAPGMAAGRGSAIMDEAFRLSDMRIRRVGCDVLVEGYLGQADTYTRDG